MDERLTGLLRSVTAAGIIVLIVALFLGAFMLAFWVLYLLNPPYEGSGAM